MVIRVGELVGGSELADPSWSAGDVGGADEADGVDGGGWGGRSGDREGHKIVKAIMLSSNCWTA